MNKSIEFKSIKELYDRVKPALYSKVKELRGLGYKNIHEELFVLNQKVYL